MSDGYDQLHNHSNEPPLPDGTTSEDFAANLAHGPVTVTYHGAPIESLQTSEARAYFKEMLRCDSLRALRAVLIAPDLDVGIQRRYLLWADSPNALEPALLDQACAPQARLADMRTDLIREPDGRMARRLYIGAYGPGNIAQALDLIGFITDAAKEELADNYLEVVRPDGSREHL